MEAHLSRLRPMGQELRRLEQLQLLPPQQQQPQPQ